MYYCLRLIYTRRVLLQWFEARETPRMRKYGESKTTRIMMATVPHVIAWAERTKYQADGFLFDGVYFMKIQRDCKAAYWITPYLLTHLSTVRFVLTKVYIPLANVLHLMICRTVCGLQQVNTHIHQLNHPRTFPHCKRSFEYLASLEFRYSRR